MCHELAVNSDIQDRLYEEILETKKKLNGNRLTFEALQRMKYLDCVVSETLRKWPSGSNLMDRAVNKPYTLEQNDGTKVVLQTNDVIYIPTYAIQHDPKYFPNPEVFDPDRFSDENKRNIHPCAFLAFGSGPRGCIASRFALVQLKAVIYHILLEFKIECSAKTSIPLKLKGGTRTLEPIDGFYNQFTIRE